MTIVRDSFYINGEWVKARSSETIEVTTSGTGEVFATVVLVGRQRVERQKQGDEDDGADEDEHRVAQEDRRAAAEDHAAAGRRLARQHLLRRLAEVGRRRQRRGRPRRGRDVLADESAQHPLEPVRAELLVMRLGIVEGDGELLGHGRGDRPVEKRDSEALCECGADPAAASAVGAGDCDQSAQLTTLSALAAGALGRRCVLELSSSR